MKKGFVLSFDAMTAAGVAVLMTLAVVGIVSAKSPDMRAPYSAAGDILAATDANGELQKYAGYSEPQIRQSMQAALQALPKNFCGNMTVTVFDANDFGRSGAYSESSCAAGPEASKAKRIFADYNSQKFGIAEISVWMK